MMATRRVNAATTWLIRAFAPGCPTMLRSWESSRVSGEGERCERLTIYFDLPTEPAVDRAKELERSAGALRHIRIGRTVVRDLSAQVSDAQRVLKVEALLAADGGLQ